MRKVKSLVAALAVVGVVSFGSALSAKADTVVINSSCGCLCPTTKTVVIDYGVPQCILDKTCVYLQHADQCVLNCGLPDCGGCCGSSAVKVITETCK